MDRKKLDGALRLAVDDAERLKQSVRLPILLEAEGRLDESRQALLTRIGVRNPREAGGVMSGSVTPKGLSELTAQPWIRYVQLARRLTLANEQRSGGYRVKRPTKVSPLTAF